MSPAPCRPLLLALLWALTGCGVQRLSLHRPLPAPLDAIIVPGCPSAAGGALSPCQLRRAAWAAILWERGLALRFITSGAAVHSRYVEAEALAAAMAGLGVPPGRIYLEPDALHTDENMYNSLQIARRLGLRRLAVASEGGHALGACEMLVGWRQPCAALPLDAGLVKARLDRSGDLLRTLRTAAVPEWLPLRERERRIARRTGRSRPPSFFLYPMMAIWRLLGRQWRPNAPAVAPVETWADRVEQARRPPPPARPAPW